MDLPRQFQYGPQWRIIFCLFTAGISLLALAIFHLVSRRAGVALSIFPLGVALIATARRLFFPRFIDLRQDTLLVCTGFLQAQVTEIPYPDIENGWEVVRGRMNVLTLRTKERTIEINSILLPNMASYVAVKDFLKSRFTQKEQAHGQRQPSEAGKYCFKCSYEGNGEIYDSNGEILWRVKTKHFNARPRYPYGFFRLPDFVVYDKTDTELFIVKRERKLALAQFVIVEKGRPVCTIRLRSILRNKYTLDFVNGQKWVFRMPLFTVNFRGFSEVGEEIRVRQWSHNLWYVLIDTKADNPQLVAALAFIHRERLRFN